MYKVGGIGFGQKTHFLSQIVYAQLSQSVLSVCEQYFPTLLTLDKDDRSL